MICVFFVVKTMVRDSKISGNVDLPEGGFDGIVQAIVCEQAIGWRSLARRLLIFTSDAGFHSAGDGKVRLNNVT